MQTSKYPNLRPRPSLASVHSIGSAKSLQFPLVSQNATAKPTTSVNLDETLAQPAAQPQLDDIPEDNSTFNRPLRSLFQGPLDEADECHTSTDAITINTQATSSCNEGLLLNRLARSMYSFTLNTSNDNQNRPYVSAELPDVFNYQPQNKSYFILTMAGKPVYVKHHSDNGNDASLVSVIHTMFSYFKIQAAESGLRSIKLPLTGGKFYFLDKNPILLMAYSEEDENTCELEYQLDFLHSYIISSLSGRRLSKLFERKDNFDLRNYLEPSDFENLDEITSTFFNKHNPDLSLSALRSLPLRRNQRHAIHASMLKALVKDSKLPRGTLLYGLIVSPTNKLCAVLRPSTHTLHTTDLQLLFCLVFNRFQSADANKEFWVPLCFPKFNPNGFLYCYISFLPSPTNSTDDENRPALILITAQKDMFFELQKLGSNLVLDLKTTKLLNCIWSAQKSFRISDVPAPFVHHFIYKSKMHVQYFMPEMEYNSKRIIVNEHNEEEDIHSLEYSKRLKRFYQQLHDSVHNDRGGPISKSCLNFLRWHSKQSPATVDGTQTFFKQEPTNVMGIAWTSPRFELYILFNNGLESKGIALKSAKKIVSWCLKNERRLFIAESAVF